MAYGRRRSRGRRGMKRRPIRRGYRKSKWVSRINTSGRGGYRL